MSFSKTLAVGVLAIASLNASALEIVNGNYGVGRNVYKYRSERYVKGEAEAYKVEQGQNPDARFALSRSGNHLTLKDMKRNITYNLDIGSRGEQVMPEAYLTALRSRPERLGSMGQLIKKISFVNVNETNEAITADILIEIGSNGSFGSTSAVVKLSSKLKTRELVNGGNDCAISSNEYSYINRKSNSNLVKTTCYSGSIGENVDLVSMTVGGGSVGKFMGSVVDLALKLAGGQFFRHDDIVRTGETR